MGNSEEMRAICLNHQRQQRCPSRRKMDETRRQGRLRRGTEQEKDRGVVVRREGGSMGWGRSEATQAVGERRGV